MFRRMIYGTVCFRTQLMKSGASKRSKDELSRLCKVNLQARDTDYCKKILESDNMGPLRQDTAQ